MFKKLSIFLYKSIEADGDKTMDESQTFDGDSERDPTESSDNMIVTDELDDEELNENNENDIASSELEIVSC